MPNLRDLLGVGGDGDEVLGDRRLVAAARASAQSRAVRALVIVSSVVKVFEETMNSVSAGSRSRVASTKSVPSTLETKRKVMSRRAVVAQRLVGHHRAEVGAADADVDDVADRACRCGPSSRRCGRARRRRPCGRARRGPPARRPRRRPRSSCRAGARRATCSTARSSVTLIFSPRNMASMRSRRPALLGQLRAAAAASRR